MARIKLTDRVLPKYSNGEEMFNMISHVVGASIGFVSLILCTWISATHQNIFALISTIVFSISLIILYTASSVYHGLHKELLAKKVFQILDHCSIFLLIAGTYTPILLCSFRQYNVVLGWVLFAIIWAFAIIGITLNAIDIKKFKIFSIICYLFMGWMVIFKAPLLPQLLTTKGFILLLLGGISYTVGAILYGVGKKYKWMHSVFHIMCVLGSLAHFLCIAYYVL